jgi:hypothetical protein
VADPTTPEPDTAPSAESNHKLAIEHLRLPLSANGHWFRRDAEVKAVRLDGELFTAGSAPVCGSCGLHPKTRIVGESAEIVDRCAFPGGMTTEITIDVPSGRLLVSDNLHPVFHVELPLSPAYESALGKAQVMRAMAALGCACGPASDRGLHLVRTGPDRFIMVTPGCDDYDDEDNPRVPGGTCVATLCTDVWAYACADFDLWMARGGDPATLDWGDTVVDVAPGTYRYVHHSGESGFDPDSADMVTWAHVERIA